MEYKIKLKKRMKGVMSKKDVVNNKIIFESNIKDLVFVEVLWKDAVNVARTYYQDDSMELVKYRSFGHLFLQDKERTVLVYGINEGGEIDYLIIPTQSIIRIKNLISGESGG